MKNGKRVVLGVVCFLFLLCAGSLCASAAELPDLSLKHCMTVYPWKTGRVTVYETDTLSKKKEVIPYDMCKAVQKDMRIENIRLLSKSGGKSGDYKIKE